MPENAMHDIIMENRRKVTMTGINDVESFDEETIIAASQCGTVTLNGHNLKISRLSVESGDMVVEGDIDSVCYTDGGIKSGFFGRVFR